MKRIAILLPFFVAFLCLAQSSHAQIISDFFRDRESEQHQERSVWRSSIHRDHDHFVDQDGQVLSDSELLELMKMTEGEDVYYDTIVGARKQYNAGRKLIIGGSIGAGVGATFTLAGFALMASSAGKASEHSHAAEDLGFSGAYLASFGLVALGLGGAVLSAGIPLHSIGKCRLNWVQDVYPWGYEDIALQIGATDHGFGLSLRF